MGDNHPGDRLPALYIDCARADPCVGLVEQHRAHIVAIERNPTDRRGVNLYAELERLLERSAITWADLRCVAVGVGPGPMTGIRVGLATTIGICQSLEVPAIAVPSWYNAFDLNGPAVQQIVVPTGRERAMAATVNRDSAGWSWTEESTVLQTHQPREVQPETIQAIVAENSPVDVISIAALYLREPDAEPQFDAFGRPLDRIPDVTA